MGSEFLFEFYKKIYLIRACELAIIKEYDNNQMKTPMHMSMGSEHISSLVCLALKDRAQVFSSYRSHAPFLARTEDTDQFFLEMYGKQDSVVGGRGGSMHLCYPEKGFILSSAVVATQISVACGYAWANKQKKNDKVVVVFFGDGAIEEGSFWESLNLACLYKLPIIFVCEDNELAVHTDKQERNFFKLNEKLFSNFCCEYYHFPLKLDKVEIAKVFERLSLSIRPLFLHCDYHRMLSHVGVNEDYDVGYRVKPDIKTVDPLLLMLRERIFNVDALENEIDKKVERSLEAAKK